MSDQSEIELKQGLKALEVQLQLMNKVLVEGLERLTEVDRKLMDIGGILYVAHKLDPESVALLLSADNR